MRMVLKARENLIGAWAFLIGVILAVIIGLFSSYLGQATIAIQSILAVIGIVVGLLNISDKDITTFLWASLSLVVVGYMGQNALGIIAQIGGILNALLLMFVPATIIVALKAVFSIARS